MPRLAYAASVPLKEIQRVHELKNYSGRQLWLVCKTSSESSVKSYNHRNCQSLFGYAAEVHVRSGGQCQLCLCGEQPLNFDLWRQMTVEHIIGKSQGGYLHQIREAVALRFPDLTAEGQEAAAQRLDAANTVSACSFCNSTTSRKVNEKSMSVVLNEASGTVEEVIAYAKIELQQILEAKRREVHWKLSSIRQAFERDVASRLSKAEGQASRLSEPPHHHSVMNL